MNWVNEMSELEMEQLRLKKKHEGKKKHKIKENKNISKTFTHVLIAIIFILVSLIYTNWSENNYNQYKKAVFETTLSFTSINEWYEKYFGSALPIELKEPTIPVNNTKNEILNVTKYLNGVEAHVTKGSSISSLNSGILVFLGEKDGYGNTAIIQGIDGVDIWYGNIENVNLSLYDYVEKNTLIGSAKTDSFYYVFQKDDQFLDYEEYKNEI